MEPIIIEPKEPQNRLYYFENGEKIWIKGITKITIGDTNIHHIECSSGKKWLIPRKWIAIEITNLKEWNRVPK